MRSPVAPRESVTSIAAMPGSLRNAVLGAVAATAIAGCGSDDGTIPPDNASNLISQLDAIESNFENQECEQALDHAETFKSNVNLLPASVEDEVKEGLQQTADRLVNLAESDCETPEGTTDIGGAVEPDTTDEETTEQPEESTEEPVEPQTEEAQQDQDLTPPEGNEGQGGGNVGSDGGVSPSSGGVGSGGEG